MEETNKKKQIQKKVKDSERKNFCTVESLLFSCYIRLKN